MEVPFKQSILVGRQFERMVGLVNQSLSKATASTKLTKPPKIPNTMLHEKPVIIPEG